MCRGLEISKRMHAVLWPKHERDRRSVGRGQRQDHREPECLEADAFLKAVRTLPRSGSCLERPLRVPGPEWLEVRQSEGWMAMRKRFRGRDRGLGQDRDGGAEPSWRVSCWR